MVYTIEQERLLKVMMKLFKEILPDFVLPLKTKVSWTKRNSGYGSSMDDYNTAIIHHVDGNNTVWFIEYDDWDKFTSDYKWDVNEKLNPLYDYFGEDAFAMFIKKVFNLDLLNKGSYLNDWIFTDTDYVITESEQSRYVVDDISDDKLLKIINKLVLYVYGRELTMSEHESGYLRFLSSGPVPPYHRNLSGRLWVDDDRLEKIIEQVFGVDSEQAAALIAFYFSEKYGIKITDARPPLSMGWYNRVIDYKMYDDPTYKEPEDDDY